MSPALVKASIDYCHANAITFGNNVTIGGNLLVSGTSTFTGNQTFNGAATFNGVASGQSPTANSHFATKGYVDTKDSEIINSLSPVLLYESVENITKNDTLFNSKSDINLKYSTIIYEVDTTNVNVSFTNISAFFIYLFSNSGYSIGYSYYTNIGVEANFYKKKIPIILNLSSLTTENDTELGYKLSYSGIEVRTKDNVIFPSGRAILKTTYNSLKSVSGTIGIKLYGINPF